MAEKVVIKIRDDTDSDTRLYIGAHLKLLDRSESTFSRQIRELFDAQEKEVIQNLSLLKNQYGIIKAVTKGIDDVLFNKEVAVQAFLTVAKPLYKVLVQEGARTTESKTRPAESIDVNSELIQEYLDTKALRFATLVNDTTAQAIRRELQAGIANGEQLGEIAVRIGQVYDTARSSRALTIARTEVGSAINFGREQGILANTDYLYKRWVTVLDDREREAHRRAHLQTVPKTENFNVDGESLRYPRDPSGSAENIINCRCLVQGRRTKRR